MISAIGASFLLQNLATVIFGGRPKGFPVPSIFEKVLRIGSAPSDKAVALADEATLASELADKAAAIASEAAALAGELAGEASALASEAAVLASEATELAGEAVVLASEAAQVEASFGGVSVLSVNLVIPVLTAILLIVLQTIVRKTKTGMAMRAVSTDLPAARLMAIDVNKVIMFTFGTGSVLAAIGGVMWMYKYRTLIPTIGTIPGLKCFIAAVIGGIGNIPGAMLGGLLLGFIEIMAIAALPKLTGYRDALAFVLLIIVLLVKPSGLLGKHQIEKV
jgi:branched-subunit amino acid ABC-type transport system permease component